MTGTGIDVVVGLVMALTLAFWVGGALWQRRKQ